MNAAFQARRDMQELDEFNSSKKWQKIANEGLAPLQNAYLAAIDSLSNGTSTELLKAIREAGAVLKQLLGLERKAQDCYIDTQISTLENTETNPDPNIEGKKKLRFHFFCSHVSAEMATHVSATAMGLKHLGCDVWTDQQGVLDIDAFGMVRPIPCTQRTNPRPVHFDVTT